MVRFGLIILLLQFVPHGTAQKIIQQGELYGVVYPGGIRYSAVFDEIKVTDYFVHGRQENLWFNLSPDKENSEIAYKKFDFDLIDQLLIVGIRANGGIDILDETGEHFYVENAAYDKVITKSTESTFGSSDFLMVKKNGKKGLINWVGQKEILPPEFNEIILHSDCRAGDYVFYARKQKENILFDKYGNQILSFRLGGVDDLYPENNCQGFMIRRINRFGYLTKMKNGKYFLIKPRYEAIRFPRGDHSVIFVRRGEHWGLYYNFKRYLKCKYDEITIIDSPYILAEVIRNEKKNLLKLNGELTSVRE